MNEKIIIIGGGLSGLSLAYFLKKSNIQTLLLEASDRIGGRIKTVKGKQNAPLELGATWFLKEHSHLIQLLDELKIDTYPQFRTGVSLFHTELTKMPQEFEIAANEPFSYRIAGGTEHIIETLQQQLSEVEIKLNTKVVAVSYQNHQLEVSTSNGTKLRGKKVVICIPPQLAHTNIKFIPNLPNSLFELMPTVQTWMANSIKFVIEYDSPFWRHHNLSGMLFSHVGIVIEMYDHTNKEENKFGFTGFLHPNAQHISKLEREKAVIDYLHPFFGDLVFNYLFYEDQQWNNSNLIGDNFTALQAHLNNGHQLLKSPYMNDKLYFAGSETSSEFPGYMDAAVNSVKRVYQQIIDIN